MASRCRKWIYAILLLLFSIFMVVPDTACVQAERAVLVTLEERQDLVVNFSFDKQIVDITFISPSGKNLGPDSSDVEVTTGELWATYRIPNAQSGEWSVRYEMGKNNDIQYSIIQEHYGVWIQYFNISEPASDSIRVGFKADCEVQDVYYDYEIYAVGTSEGDDAQLLTSGRALSGEEQSEDVSLSQLSSGEYILSLEISCQDGNAEMFDSMHSEKFSYSNPDEPGSIGGYSVYVDVGNLSCDVIWEDNSVYCDAYRLTAYSNGKEQVYDMTTQDGEETGVQFSFPKDSKKLEIALFYKYDGIWSKPLKKVVALEGGEYLRVATDEITGDGQAVLEYGVERERTLSLSLNEGEISEYQLEGEGDMAFSLNEGSNAVYAQFESDNGIFYIAEKEIYFDAYPPEIILYENIDGKTFRGGSVNVLGKIKGGNALLANGKDVGLDESGRFSVDFDLALGENVLSLEAMDANGNATQQDLTFYFEPVTMVTGGAAGWHFFLPLLAALSVSVLLFLFELLFMKKRKKKGKRKGCRSIVAIVIVMAALLVADIFCACQFLTYALTAESQEFISMAERSVSQAARYLQMRNLFGIAAGCGTLLWTLALLIIIYKWKREGRADKDRMR